MWRPRTRFMTALHGFLSMRLTSTRRYRATSATTIARFNDRSRHARSLIELKRHAGSQDVDFEVAGGGGFAFGELFAAGFAAVDDRDVAVADDLELAAAHDDGGLFFDADAHQVGIVDHRQGQPVESAFL